MSHAASGTEGPAAKHSPKRRSADGAADASERLKQMRISVKDRLLRTQQEQAAKLAELQRKYPQQLGPVRPPTNFAGGRSGSGSSGAGGGGGLDSGAAASGAQGRPNGAEPAGARAFTKVAGSPAADTSNLRSSLQPAPRLASGSGAKAVRHNKKTKSKSRPPPAPGKRGLGRFASSSSIKGKDGKARGGRGRFQRSAAADGAASAAGPAAAATDDSGGEFLPAIHKTIDERPSTWPNSDALGDGGTVDWSEGHPVFDQAEVKQQNTRE
eukprot:INCI1096.1.p1 GENE.INCI1096.1~~INCI1096.1.p1  ORF type:complete len:269 (-),score=54.56 INCI1096.1:578-1384(-)